MNYKKSFLQNIGTRRSTFLRLRAVVGTAIILGLSGHSVLAEPAEKPNILILMTDNQYAPHLGCYGDNVVKTPHIDRIAKRGVRFTNAFCAVPSCTPARAGYLTGQDIWRLEEGANLWGILPNKFPIYTDMLSESGYFVGYEGKGWGPGNIPESGRPQNHAGTKYKSFDEFLKANADGKPWSYWLCCKNPHRPYKLGSGVASGMKLEDVVVPPYLPDCEEIRSDICDYYLEIEQFDDLVKETIELLRNTGQMDNTLIVICSDNGWQMPRGLASLYDFGSKVPLIISWPGQIQPDRVVDDYVNLNDLAPTFLELAGVNRPEEMTAKSLNNILFSGKSGQIEKDRNFIVTGLERHAMCRQDGVGYPGRAIRMDGYLYIHNFEPDRWPAGDPPLFGDIDAFQLHYYCPTKEYMMEHKDDPEVAPLYKLAFLKRPEEELFDLTNDPHQMTNLADDPKHAEIKKKLQNKLTEYLRETGDPRMTGDEVKWDDYTYYAKNGFRVRPRKEAIEQFNLKSEYDYRIDKTE
jgi:arylsulfatase A-like enzyme